MVEELKKVLASRDEYLKSDSYAFNAYRRYQESCLEFFNGDHGQALLEALDRSDKYREALVTIRDSTFRSAVTLRGYADDRLNAMDARRKTVDGGGA